MITLLIDDKDLNENLKRKLFNLGYDVIEQFSCFSDAYVLSYRYVNDDFESRLEKTILLINSEEELPEIANSVQYCFFSPFDAENIVKVIKNKVINYNQYSIHVENILLSVGISYNTKGYKYLKKAILLLCGKKDYKIKEIYEVIAAIYNTTKENVERLIRYAIESAFDKGNIEKSIELFGYSIDPEKGKPTNSEFIKRICDYIKLKAMSNS